MFLFSDFLFISVLLFTNSGLSKSLRIPDFSKKGNKATIPRIVGGQQCQSLEFPWMASLQYRGKHFCGGTLISDQWVLTAAHCVDRNSYQPIEVLLGAHSLALSDANHRRLQTKLILVHENWNSKQISDDIALIKLSRRVDLDGADRHIQTIDLPLKNLTVADGQQCVAIGWGKVDANSKLSDILLKVTLPVVAQSVCQKNYAQDVEVRAGNICLGGERGRGICNGDSGGPMQCLIAGKWAFVGLDSFTAICALKYFPSVFTRITFYLDWISWRMSRN